MPVFEHMGPKEPPSDLDKASTLYNRAYEFLKHETNANESEITRLRTERIIVTFLFMINV